MSNNCYIKYKHTGDLLEEDKWLACFSDLSSFFNPLTLKFTINHEWFLKGTNPDYWLWKMNLEDKLNIPTDGEYWVMENKKPNYIHFVGMLARCPMESEYWCSVIRPFKETLEKFNYDPLQCVWHWATSERGKEPVGWEGTPHGITCDRMDIENPIFDVKKAISDLEKTKWWFNDSWRRNDRIGLVS